MSFLRLPHLLGSKGSLAATFEINLQTERSIVKVVCGFKVVIFAQATGKCYAANPR